VNDTSSRRSFAPDGTGFVIMRTPSTVLCLICLVLGAAPRTWAAAALTRHPYPQSLSRDRVTIMWRTATPAVQTVEFGTGTASFERLQTEPAATTNHEVTLTGLQPGTRYTYRIVEDGAVVVTDPELWFKTDAGRELDTFSFFFTGDIGDEPPDGMQAVTGNMIRNVYPRADFGLLCGDIIYPDGESTMYDAQLMTPWKDLMCNTPIYPALGNHDWHVDPDANFVREWSLPNNEHWYSFDYGNAHFIALDSADGFLYDEANQVAWLRQDLTAAHFRGTTWTFVYYHHPVLTCTYKSNIPEMADVLFPIFNEYGVDFVFNGHAHTYERQYPLRNGVPVNQNQGQQYVDPDGFITIISGCGGKFNTNEPTSFCGPTAAFADERILFSQAFVYGNTIYIVTFDSSTGQVVDWVRVTKTHGPTDVTVAPARRGLGQNIPNPFNPTTFIPFEIPRSRRPSMSCCASTGSMAGGSSTWRTGSSPPDLTR
jgi:hypothetical protein